jgi:hypothetical protein
MEENEDFVITAEVGGDYVLAPSGNHVAICFGVVYCGTVPGTYNGIPNKEKKTIMLFELCNKKHTFKPENGEEPHIVAKEFTHSMGKKANMRKALVSWRGEDMTDAQAKTFNIAGLPEVPCRLNVVHKTSGKGTKYVDVSSISPLEEEAVLPEMHYPKTVFSILKTPFNVDAFNALPQWIQDKIKKSDEYASILNPNSIDAATSVAVADTTTTENVVTPAPAPTKKRRTPF